MDPTLVPGTRFEFQFQICVYEHAILRIYISFFSNNWYSPVGSGNYLEWVSKLMVPGSSPRRRKKPL